MRQQEVEDEPTRIGARRVKKLVTRVAAAPCVAKAIDQDATQKYHRTQGHILLAITAAFAFDPLLVAQRRRIAFWM